LSKSISINGRKIGLDHLPYVIAEMSANHNGDVNNANKIIHMAKAPRADADVIIGKILPREKRQYLDS